MTPSDDDEPPDDDDQPTAANVRQGAMLTIAVFAAMIVIMAIMANI